MKLNYLRTAAEHHLDSVACRRPLPQKKSHGSFLQSFLLLAALLLAGSGVSWGQTIISTFSMPSENPTPAFDDAYVLSDQGAVKYYAQGLKDGSGNHVTSVVNGQTYRKLQDNDIEKAHIKLQFAAGTIKAGDVLSITCVHVYGDTNDSKTQDNGTVDNDNNVVGFEMGVSGTVVSGRYKGTPLTLTHTITASEIVDNGDGNEYIRIGRMDWKQSAYGTITVTRPTSFTVTWDNSSIPTGCDAWFTVGDDATQYRSTKNDVLDGTSVTFHGTDSGNDSKMIQGWYGANNTYLGYGATKTVTVNSDISVKPDFQNCILLNLTTSPAEGGTATVTVNGNDANGKKFFQSVNPTFTANANTGYHFVGWYQGSSKLSSDNSYNGQFSNNTSAMVVNVVAKFESDVVTHPANITCVNNTIDLSKITVGWGGASYDPSTHAGSITADYGTISVKFASAIDLHELNTLTLAGTNVEKTNDAGAFNGVTFVCEDGNVSDYNYPFVSTLSDTDKEKLKKVTAIEFAGGNTDAHKGDFTLTSITLTFGGSHTKKSTPVLNNGTTEDMVVAAGRKFTLSATNGYWREYKSDFSGEKDGGCISGVWAPQHEFTSGLTVGDYYFGIQDNSNTNCAFGVNHHSDLTRVHVKVVAATPNITSCENAHIDLANIRVYGNATYNGSNGQFVVNNYNQYGNGLQIAFAQPQDLSNAKTIIINGAEFKNPNMKEVDSSDTRWPNVEAKDGKTVINLNNKNNANYDAITLIDLRDIPAGTYTISSIDVEFDHTPATPQFKNGTATTMVVVQGKDLKLSTETGAFWHEYDAINGTLKTERIASDAKESEYTFSGLAKGTYYFAAEKVNHCEFGVDHVAEKNWVTVDVEPQGTIPTELDLIKQPIYGQNHGGMAKEYLAIANLKASNGDDVAGWGVTSATGTEYKNTTDDKSTTDVTTKQKIAYVLGGHTYKVNSENGLCISQWGRAGLVENQAALPTRATLMLKAAGTMDFFILAKNLANGGDGSDASRRHIKVWYTNNQNVDASGNRILMPFKCANNNTNNDFWFYGERLEDRSNNLAPLQVGVRLQHLGSDGTCNVFITYEDDVKDENVWIKGILVKRPDLDVTIGRTDKLYYTDGKPNHSNCELTPFGENRPYQWDFGTAGFYAKKPNTSGTATDELKKVNEHDGRTYICGEHNGVQLMDHLLVYSDGKGDDKANFDGRKLTNGHDKYYPEDESDCNEHIEFLHPTKYSGKNTYEEDQVGFDGDRRSFNPILSNGLKVNVTGSGWFTIACAAPNGPVNMKVLSSTNGGSTYINLLREFVVSNEEDADKDDANYNKDTSWHTYRVYLKAHHEQGYKDKDNHFTDQSEGFWDGNVYKQKYTKDNVDYDINDPEESQMSLYVVFDKLETYKGQPVTYADNGNSADAQLNIHYLQWINEKPVDYVFQREEDPALLNSRQSIVTESATDAKPTLYWQAGTRLVEGKKSSTSKTSNYVGSAYNSAGQQDREVGQKSGNGFVSNGDLNCQWNVAAFAHSAAHTEVAYQGGATNYGNNTTNVYSTDQANGTTSDQNLEFAIPVSGSFFRFMPMKNQFISTWIVPSPDKDGETELTETIYVLDETGKPIPYIQEADMQDANKSKVTQDARERGWVQNASNGLDKPGNTAVFTTQNVDGQTAAVRIDFAALAGKEYFIVSDKGTIALARMKVTGNDYRAKVEEISSPVTLTDGGTDNASKISTAMGGTGRYASENKAITLTGRTFKANTWAALVLPFSLNEKKLEDIFGVGTKCLHFTEVEKATNTIVFTHHFYNMVVAGRPVFVYPTQEVKNPVFTDVTLSAETVTNTNTNGGDFTFQASYDNATISKGDLFMNNQNGTNYWTGTDNSYPGMRSFIKNNNNWDFSTGVSTNIGAKAVFLNFDEIMDEEISTSIDEFVRGEFGENAVVITKSTKAYDLNGRVVADGANISHLPAGIYIVNGKKFIVK